MKRFQLLFLFVLTIPQVAFPCSYQLTIQDKIMEHKEQILIGTACAGLAVGAGYFVYNYYYKDQQSSNTPSPEPDLGQNTKNIFQLKKKETLTPKKQQFENVTNAQVYKNSNHISNPSQNPQETVVLKQNKEPLATTTNTPDDQQILWHAISNLPSEIQERIPFDFLQQQGGYEKSSLGLIKITKKEKNNFRIYSPQSFPENLIGYLKKSFGYSYKVSWITDLTGIVLSKDGLLYTFALDRENNTISTHQQTIKDKDGKILRIRRIAVDYINKHYIVFIDKKKTGLFLIDLRSKQNTFIKLHYLSQEIANIQMVLMSNNTIRIIRKNETVTTSTIDIIPEYALSNFVVDQKNKNSQIQAEDLSEDLNSLFSS